MRILFFSVIFISFFWASTFVFGLPIESSTTPANNNESKDPLSKILEFFWIIWLFCFVLLFCSCFFFRFITKDATNNRQNSFSINLSYVCVWILIFVLLIGIAIVKIVLQFINFVNVVNENASSEIDSFTGLNKTELTNLHMFPMNTSLIPESERMAKVEEMKFFNLWQWLLLIPFIVVLLSKSWFPSRTVHGCILILLGSLIVVPIIIKQISYQIEISGKDVYIGGENIIVIRNKTAPKPLQQQFECSLLNNPDRKFRDCCTYCDLHFQCFNFNFYNGTCFPFVADHDVDFNFYGIPQRKGKSPPPRISRWKTAIEKEETSKESKPIK